MNADDFFYRYRCPAMMADGRIFTNYASSQTIVDAIRATNGWQYPKFDNNDLRSLMVKNADKIMQRERVFVAKTRACRFPPRRKVIIIDPPYATPKCQLIVAKKKK